MTERDMQHGRDWAGQDLTGWFASEKLNGVRAYWDGSDMWTRGGMKVALLATWRESLPDGVTLDGEVYDGTDGLARCVDAVTHGRFAASMTFNVFDAPGDVGAWAARMSCAAVVARGIVRCVPFWAVASSAHAIADMLRVQARGGEGLMLRRPDLRYRPGRTFDLLKVKPVNP